MKNDKTSTVGPLPKGEQGNFQRLLFTSFKSKVTAVKLKLQI